jgi:hypothetical protein
LFFVSKDNTIVNSNVFSFIVAIAFSVSSTWTSSMNDKFRYWMLLVWWILLIIWTSWLLVLSYTAWNLDWAALGRFILPLWALIYQFKIIKKYL